jgi:hypothetical protein
MLRAIATCVYASELRVDRLSNITHIRCLPMDLPISRSDRIRRILRNSAAGDALRVHARLQIARTCADFDRFSESCDN